MVSCAGSQSNGGCCCLLPLVSALPGLPATSYPASWSELVMCRAAGPLSAWRPLIRLHSKARQPAAAAPACSGEI
jgi:hypothetical protein